MSEETVTRDVSPMVREAAAKYARVRNMPKATIARYENGGADEEPLLQALQDVFELGMSAGNPPVSEDVEDESDRAVYGDPAFEEFKTKASQTETALVAAQMRTNDLEAQNKGLLEANSRQVSSISKLAAKVTNAVTALNAIRDRNNQSFFGRKAAIETICDNAIADANLD